MDNLKNQITRTMMRDTLAAETLLILDNPDSTDEELKEHLVRNYEPDCFDEETQVMLGLRIAPDATKQKYLDQQFLRTCPILPENVQSRKVQLRTELGKTNWLDVTPMQWRAIEEVLRNIE